MAARALAMGLVVVVMGLLAASSAHAAPLVGQAPDEDGGAGAAFGFGLQDTRGVSVWDMNMSLYEGNALNPGDLGKRMWAAAMDGGWAAYRLVTATQIWTLDWVLGLEWMDWVLEPLRGLADLTQSLMGQLGLMPLMLIVLGTVVTIWVIRGRFAGGVVELLVGCVVASLATGALIDPMGVVAGPNGMLMTGRDAGVELASVVATDGASHSTDLDAYRAGLTGSMVDTMIRTPHQLLNYGTVLDGTACESTYDDVVAGENAREQVGDCSAAAKTYSDSPDALKAMAVMTTLPAAFSLSIFALSLVVLTMLTVLGAGLTAIRLIPQLVLGVIPGRSRSALYRALAMVVFAELMLAVAILFVVVWMRFIAGFFSSSAGVPWMARIWLVNALLVVGAVGVWVVRHKMKTTLGQIAEQLAKVTGGSASRPTTMPHLPLSLNPPSRRPPTLPAPRPSLAPQPKADPALPPPGPLPPTPPPSPGPPNPSPRPRPGPVPGSSSSRTLTSGPAGRAGAVRYALAAAGGSRAPQLTQATSKVVAVRRASSVAVQAGAAAATGGASLVNTAAGVAAKAAAVTGAKVAARAAVQHATTAAGMGGGRSVVEDAARSVRNQAVRDRLRQVQMRAVGDRLVDQDTGTAYAVRPGPGAGVQILSPTTMTDKRRAGGKR